MTLKYSSRDFFKEVDPGPHTIKVLMKDASGNSAIIEIPLMLGGDDGLINQDDLEEKVLVTKKKKEAEIFPPQEGV